jgi:acetyl esterase
MTWGVHVTLATKWLDPAEVEADITPFMIHYALHDALVKPMPGNLHTPSLAESWTMSKDGRTWEFVLRKNVRFHNGDPVTAHGFDTASYRENGEGYMLTREGMKWFWNHYLAKPEDGQQPYASPLLAKDVSGLAPALVITAEYDPLRDEGEEYAKRLAEAGVPVTVSRYPGLVHGFIRMINILDPAKRAVDEVAAALRKAFA